MALQEALAALQARQITTLTQLRVLLAINAGARPVSRVCEDIDVPFSTGSRVIFEFYQMGLAQYVDSTDRRVKIIRLTKKGAALVSPIAA
jgi:DNA-binding MarR family transcriptional regulator